MRRRSSGPVRAVLGPCIHPECYEFSPADLEPIADRLGPEVAGSTAGGRLALDVPRAVALALAGAGVTDITDVDVCTACSADHFSHRRDGRARACRPCWWRPGDRAPSHGGSEEVSGRGRRMVRGERHRRPARGRRRPAGGGQRNGWPTPPAGSGARPSAVRLVVVTKGVPPPVMQAVLDAGATDLGENRAQELLAKAPELAGPPGTPRAPGARPGTSSGGCSATRSPPWRRWSTSGSRSTGSSSGRPSPAGPRGRRCWPRSTWPTTRPRPAWPPTTRRPWSRGCGRPG